MSGPRIGSLCSGYGGLDMGVQSVLGGGVAWHVEYDRDPSRILAHHWPDVPNHGDVKLTDWANVEPVDILTAGYPCQPFSHAGKRKGADDPRHLWPDVARAIGVLRPGLVVLENVRGHVSLGLADVLGDLSALGYDTTWGVVRASDAAAPHGRARIFITAADTRSGPLAGTTATGDRLPIAPQRRRLAPANAHLAGREARGDTGHDSQRLRLQPLGPAAPSPDARGERHGGRQDTRGLGCLDGDAAGPAWERQRPRPVAGHRGAAAAPRSGESPVEWGTYGPAIARWEHVLGRPAPRPTEPGRNGPRLSPRFVEWLMGLPAGHVTDVPDLSRNAQLKALGNGVVPQQAALALRTLLPIATEESA